MAISVATPAGESELTAFILFFDEVYAARSARWPAPLAFQLRLLMGDSPFVRERTLRPFVAREDGRIVARVLAVVDGRYRRHWNEPLGHLTMFEALPGAHEATRRMMDAACAWLAENGAEAARAGMGILEFPFAIEDHHTLPPSILRQNPSYYQSLLKDAGFQTEKGLVDYRIRVTPDLIVRWEGARDAAQRGGFTIVPLGEVPEPRRYAEFTRVFNESFEQHWGMAPYTEEEITMLFRSFEPFGLLEHSVIGYRDGEPMGMLWIQGDASAKAQLAAGRSLAPEERVNTLGIGVRRPARGSGLSLGMAARAYLEFARRGYEYVSYTLVLDDNWPSRRTAEKLGATACNNYLVYRRNFAR